MKHYFLIKDNRTISDCGEVNLQKLLDYQKEVGGKIRYCEYNPEKPNEACKMMDFKVMED